jgi:hypothetical protein
MTAAPLHIRSEQELLGQHFAFRPGWWTPRIPASEWTGFFAGLPAQERGHLWISRADVLMAAQVSDPRLLPQGIVAAYVWGTGSNAYLVGRYGRVFRDAITERIIEAANDAVSILKADGPVPAYRSLQRGAPNYLKYFGPSFFTKFLYAADSRGTDPGRGLILDQFVALALADIEGWKLPRRGPWTAGEYGRWLDYAHDRASQESDRRGMPVRPDAIEMALFEHGRRLA